MKKIGSVNYHTKSCTKYSLPLQQNQQFKQAYYLKDGNISGNSPPLSTFQISLGCANINPPLGCQGFASLKSLRLWRCKLSDEITRETLLKCELLESLIIDKCRELKHVKIFGHLPCLAEANLFLDSSDNVIGIDVVKALLDEKLSHVEPLGVDYWLLRTRKLNKPTFHAIDLGYLFRQLC
ncbi:hypothetical protein CUMW_144180 [Citrus unshiu]|nr:hypothetical protein CUMW_144180 [Citrus unshiu]